MKILFVTPRLCYAGAPYAGENITYQLMRHLALRGHELYLITGLLPGTHEKIKEVASICAVLDTVDVPMAGWDILKTILRWLLRGCRDGLTVRQKVALSVATFSKQIKFDLIQVEHTALGDDITRPGNTPMVIVAHDILLKPALREYQRATGVKRFVKHIEYRALARKEIRIYKKFDKVYTLSDFDKRFIASHSSNVVVSTLKPYVRVNDFIGGGSRQPNSILYVGAMDRPVNSNAALYFYHEVFPRVKQQIPEATFSIVGNNPSAEIRELGQKDSSVVVTGFVDDVKPFYEKASVFVAPLFIGGGIIVKILESLAARLPVVTTTIGNEGIEAVPGRDILISDSPEDFARNVIRLLQDAAYWQNISTNGRKYVCDTFTWDAVLQQIEKDYTSLVQSAR